MVASYPTRDEHSRRWEQLAREIAASGPPGENAASSDSPKGALIVLGSGIQGVGFTMDAEAYLRMADKVFYCVSDAPTQVWLHKIKPDAYDLYVLYDDTKPRYSTYIQMSEAILHYVRRGMRVAAVYYGHPGIFVFSTHRAIAIARREGHYAVMKPGISALDCLCADLGVDPAFPGLQTFEATDVLLRGRNLDTSAHVVLWQIGLIGDGGYRRRGFLNDKFPVLVEYLERSYGPEHRITHYIAARHPTFEPTIAAHAIGRLLDPRVRATFTAFSTFYIPPKNTVPTDPEMALRLGVIQPGQKPAEQRAQARIDSYDPPELAALEDFGSFRVPEEYQFQERTRAAEFLIELGRNIALQDLYRQAPDRAVAEESFPGLSPLERELLAERREGSAQLAARGALVEASPDERFVIDLFQQRSLADGFRAAMASQYRGEGVAAALDAWIASQGYRATLARLPAASRLVHASMLLPWTGVYSTPDGAVVLTVIGSPDYNQASLVYAGETPLTAFTFHDGTLTWQASDGNPHSGELTFHMPATNGSSAFVRTVSGKLWAADAAAPSQPNVLAGEAVGASTALSMWTGRYTTRISKDGSLWQDGPVIEVVPGFPHLAVGGYAVDHAEFDDRTVRWDGNHVTFSDRHRLSGRVDGCEIAGIRAPGHSAPFEGRYRAWSWSGARWKPDGDVHYDGSIVRMGADTFEGTVFEQNLLQWRDERGSGSMHFFVDPATHLPKFIGYRWDAEPRPEQPNLFGVLSVDSPPAPSPPASGVWKTLAGIGRTDCDPAYHLLWAQWQRARFTSRLLNNLVPRVCEVEELSRNSNR